MDEYYYNTTITKLLRNLSVENWIDALNDKSLNKSLVRGLIKIQDSEYNQHLYELLSEFTDMDDDPVDVFDKRFFGEST
jgi:hypothetical protein